MTECPSASRALAARSTSIAMNGGTRPRREGARGIASIVQTTTRSRPLASNIAPDLPSGGSAGDLAEHRARHEARAARIIEIEQPADQFAGRIQAGDRLLRDVEHAAVGVDPQAAERECDP